MLSPTNPLTSRQPQNLSSARPGRNHLSCSPQGRSPANLCLSLCQGSSGHPFSMKTSPLPRLCSVWQRKSQRGPPLSSLHISPLHLLKSLPGCRDTCLPTSVLAYLYVSISVFRITTLSAARQKGGPQVAQPSTLEKPHQPGGGLT